MSGASGLAAIPGDIYTRVLADNPFGWDAAGRFDPLITIGVLICNKLIEILRLGSDEMSGIYLYIYIIV